MTAAGVLAAEAAQAWRSLVRRPAWLMLAAVTLALGVAAVTAVFSLIDRTLMRPMPFPEPDRLVFMGLVFDAGIVAAGPGFRTALADVPGVESMGLVSGFTRNTNVAIGDVAQVARTLLADDGLVPTLGLPMAAGRNFNADEVRPDGPQAVILTHGFWERQFGGDPSAVGTSMMVEGRAVPVIGVLPEDFDWAESFELMMPLQASRDSTVMATNEALVGRLAPGSSVESVAAAVDPLVRSAYASALGATPQSLEWLRDVRIGALPIERLAHQSQILWLFLMAAGCVLLIAAINLASLMLLRSLSRRHDAAVRVALGAPRSRLVVPALAEGALVGLCGAAIGLVLAWAGLRVFGGTVPQDWLGGAPVGLTARSVVLAVAAALAMAGLGGILGAWRGRSKAPARELVGGGRTGWSRGAGRLGRGLVVAQVALAAVLLVGAGLLTHSLCRTLSVPMGFETRDVAVFTLSPLKDRYPDLGATMEQTRRIAASLEAVPGVARATVANAAPAGEQFNMPVELGEGRTVSVQYRLVGPGYQEVLGLPPLAGRALGESDDAGGEPVAVVNAAFARAYLDGEPLGRTVRLALDGEPPLRVVGVVADTHQHGPGQPAPPMVYTPLAQASDTTWEMMRAFLPLTYMLRMQPGAGIDEPGIRRAVEAVSPLQPITAPVAMQAVVAKVTGLQKLGLVLVSLFAALALLLACVGLYSVASVAVQARRHEFGVRAALGAPPQRLFRQVLGEGMKQVALGLAVGVAVALAVSRMLQGLLYGISPADPLALGAVLVVLGAAGVLASFRPALRAARVPPMQALRVE